MLSDEEKEKKAAEIKIEIDEYYARRMKNMFGPPLTKKTEEEEESRVISL